VLCYSPCFNVKLWMHAAHHSNINPTIQPTTMFILPKAFELLNKNDHKHV